MPHRVATHSTPLRPYATHQTRAARTIPIFVATSEVAAGVQNVSTLSTLTYMPWPVPSVGEAGAVLGGDDGPALRVVRLVVDGDGRDGAEVAQHPLHLPAEVMRTPLACSPSLIGELVNGASQPTLSLLIWQRVMPDLVSMKT